MLPATGGQCVGIGDKEQGSKFRFLQCSAAGAGRQPLAPDSRILRCDFGPHPYLLHYGNYFGSRLSKANVESWNKDYLQYTVSCSTGGFKVLEDAKRCFSAKELIILTNACNM